MEINVQCEGLKETAMIYFTPYLRNLLLSGMGEITIGHGESSGDTSYLEDRSSFNEGGYAGARGHFS